MDLSKLRIIKQDSLILVNIMNQKEMQLSGHAHCVPIIPFWCARKKKARVETTRMLAEMKQFLMLMLKNELRQRHILLLGYC